MMKKKIITLCVAFIISTMFTITVSAIYDINNITNNMQYSQSVTSFNEKAEQTKKINLPDKKDKTINYISTIKSNDLYWDVYQEDNGDEYKFSKHGEKISFLRLDHVTNENATYSIEQLSAISEQYAKEYYGEQFDGFEQVSFSEGSKSAEGVINYSAIFARCYGENGFVRGETCYVTILPDGFIQSCVMSAYGRLDGFDPSTLNGIKSQDIESYIDTIVKLSYAENLVNYQISYVSLNKIDGMFVLQIPVEVEFIREGAPANLYNGEVYYYEIPQ